MSADLSLAPADPVVTSDSVTETNATADEAARRVMLSPTGTEEFKAVGSIAPAKLEENRERARDIDAEAERESRPMRELPIPRQQPSVEVPLKQELDAALEAEINAAMGGGETSTEGTLGTVTTAVAEAPAEDTLHQGKRIKGKVALLHGEDLFLDLGFRSQGILPLKQYEGKEIPAVGTEIDVIVHKVSPDEGLIHVSLPSGRQRSLAIGTPCKPDSSSIAWSRNRTRAAWKSPSVRCADFCRRGKSICDSSRISTRSSVKS